RARRGSAPLAFSIFLKRASTSRCCPLSNWIGSMVHLRSGRRRFVRSTPRRTCARRVPSTWRRRRPAPTSGGTGESLPRHDTAEVAEVATMERLTGAAAQLHALAAQDVADHLAVHQDDAGADRGVHHALLADDQGVVGGDLAGEAAVEHHGAAE